MAEENVVRIVEWPKDSARLEHSFRQDNPCHVGIIFEERPAKVDMHMDVSAQRPFPLCIKLCEPICVDSEYTVSIDVFDRPVAAITVKGRTRLTNCEDNIVK